MMTDKTGADSRAPTADCGSGASPQRAEQPIEQLAHQLAGHLAERLAKEQAEENKTEEGQAPQATTPGKGSDAAPSKAGGELK